MGLVSILHVTDLLGKHQMKPWWEKIRTATSTLLFASALYLVYGCSSIELQCHAKNSSQLFQFSYFQMCKYDLHVFWLVNFWWLSLAACGVIFFAHNWWELVPSVASSVKFYRKVCDRMEFQDNDIERTANNDTQISVKVARCYLARNIISIVISILYAGFLGYLICQLEKSGWGFDCVEGGRSVACTITEIQRVYPIMILHCAIALSHTIGFLSVIMKLRNKSNNLLKEFFRNSGESQRTGKDVQQGITDVSEQSCPLVKSEENPLVKNEEGQATQNDPNEYNQTEARVCPSCL